MEKIITRTNIKSGQRNIRISLKIESISIMIYRSYYHIVTKKTDSMPHGGKGYCDE